MPTIPCLPITTPPPTATLVPTAPRHSHPDRATSTETPMPILAPERYLIDAEKLFNNIPKSYATLTANLDNYVEATDPLADSQVGKVFLDWVKNKLIPALRGDEQKLPRVLNLDSGSPVTGRLTFGGSDARAKLIEGQPDFFISGTKAVYPGLIMPLSEPVQGKDYDQGTIMLILDERVLAGFDMGWGSLEKLANGQAVMAISMCVKVPGSTPFEGQMAGAGLDGSDYVDNHGSHWLMPAAGYIKMKGEH